MALKTVKFQNHKGLVVSWSASKNKYLLITQSHPVITLRTYTYVINVHNNYNFFKLKLL